ncbi:MAG: hypothetical protein MJ175_03280 [Clostridia bacterium]|nr:hypothetical protein [Clostridia bacterium]
MKKIFVLALAVLMIASLAVSVSALPAGQRIDVTVYKNSPVLDGVINNGEWDYANAIIMSEENCVPWAGEINNAVNFYYSWDDEGLYIAAEISDTEVCQPDDIAGVYGMDAFQIALDPHGLLGDDGQGGGMFYSIGLLSDGTLGAVYHPYGGAAQECEYKGAGRIVDGGWQFEMMLPWKEAIEILGDDGYAWTHADGEFINAIICVLDRDDGGATTNAYKTETEETAGSFAPADYALKLNLSTYTAPSLEVEEPAAETPAEETPVEEAPAEDIAPAPVAPATADAGIVAAVAVLACAAAVVVSKKH